MKKNLIAVLFLAGWCGMCSAAPARYVLREPESRLVLEGRSPLHGFEGKSSELSGEVRVDWEEGRWLQGGEIRIPVLSLKTGNDARDHALQHVTRAAGHPDIIFRVSTVRLKDEKAGLRHYALDGELEVGGVSRPVSLDVDAARQGERLSVSGKTQLSMKNFRLTVPALARWMRLEDRVDVHWDTKWEESHDGA